MLQVTYKDATGTQVVQDALEISYQSGTSPANGTGSIQITGLGNMFIPLKDVVSIGWTDTISATAPSSTSTTASSGGSTSSST